MGVFKCPNCYGKGLHPDEVPCWKCGSGKVNLYKVESATPENLNEVSPDAPGGDQQSEETDLGLLREVAEALTPLVDGRATAYISAIELEQNMDGEAWAATLVALRSRIQAELNNIEPTTPENLNEVPIERPGGDQQSEETPPAASRTLLHRQLVPVFVSDDTLHPIPAGATHYALRRLVDGPAVDFWGSDWSME